MMWLLPILAIMFLTEPNDVFDAAKAKAISEDADRAYDSQTPAPEPDKRARITSVRSDFDREAGVAMFEKNVCVEYGNDYVMLADRLFVFFKGTNKLDRIVAIGGVSITNLTRIGDCAMAEFRRLSNEVTMFGDGPKHPARLAEIGKEKNELAGASIKFWLDSEQVEVDESKIKVDQQNGKGEIL